MVASPVTQYLLSDIDSLADYERGDKLSFEDVKRRLLLLKRLEDRDVPDHYYRLNQEKSFDGIETLGELIRIGLFRLADEHLELRGNRIYVKQNKQNMWQELITYIPPLILQIAFLHIKRPLTSFKFSDIRTYYENIILPNTKYTALPYPYILQVRNYVEQNNGFMDLHIHLNGTTEVDSVWHDFIQYPDKVAEEIEKSKNNPMVKEQLEQEYFLRTPKQFRDLLIRARSIREELFNMLFGIEDDSYSDKTGSVFHPFAYLIYDDITELKYPMAIEGLMYLLAFNYLCINEREYVASIFHYYILILGLSNRLLVQQKHQYGFQQFQKVTLNKLRENVEKEYKRRFFQLHGNEQCNISFIEGRFSPKDTEKGNTEAIESIYGGWKSLLHSLKEEFSLEEDKLPELKLIAHFIKKRDNKKSIDIRHQELRFEVWQKANVLGTMKRDRHDLINNLVGIDAASSEFDTPPEVFAPSFRYLRRQGFNHFTYHAGEDFYHILGGIRAIYEAVEFNEMSIGDRIGHATAIGLSPKLWLQNVGHKLLVRQGEYLDDLIFAYHLIIRENNGLLKGKTPYIINKIEELSYSIYQQSFPLKIQEEAWLLRKYCPKMMFEPSHSEAQKLRYFDKEEWEDINLKIKDKNSDKRVHLLTLYHSQHTRNEYNKIFKIDAEEFFTVAELEELQLMMLSFLHKKEIVIETLPSSNIRIGHHTNYDTYHLWNWIKWEKEGHCIPPIVLGTDDAGIFATNIYNEYANIYCNLTANSSMGHNEAMDIIKRLDSNGRIYRFK